MRRGKRLEPANRKGGFPPVKSNFAGNPRYLANSLQPGSELDGIHAKTQVGPRKSMEFGGARWKSRKRLSALSIAAKLAPGWVITGNAWMFSADYDANNTSLNANEWLVQDGVAKLCLLWNLWWAVAEAGADGGTFGVAGCPVYKQAMSLRDRIAVSIGPPSKEKGKKKSAATDAKESALKRTHAWPYLLLNKLGREGILQEENLKQNRLVSICLPRRSHKLTSSSVYQKEPNKIKVDAAKKGITLFLGHFPHPWVRVNGIDLATGSFGALQGTQLGSHKKGMAKQYNLHEESVTLTFPDGASKHILGLFRMFWGSVGTDLAMRLERTTWSQVKKGVSLVTFQLIEESDGSQAASPLPVWLLVRWGRLLQFGPDLEQTCSAEVADACTPNEARRAVWQAFCGAKSEEAALDGTRLRGRSLQEFADALQNLIVSGDAPTQSTHGYIDIPNADGQTAKKDRQAAGSIAQLSISEPAPAAAPQKFRVRQSAGFPGEPLSVTLITQGPPFTIKSLAYQFPPELPKLPDQAMIKQLILSIDLECDDFNLSPANSNGLVITPTPSKGTSRFVKLSYSDGTPLPKDTNLCVKGRLDLGAPNITEAKNGSISAYFDPQHLVMGRVDDRQGLSSPAETIDSAESQALIEIIQDLRSNSRYGHCRIGASDFTIEPAP